MLSVLLAVLVAPQAHVPPMARIMGIDVGVDPPSRLEQLFGASKPWHGQADGPIQLWLLDSPRSVLYVRVANRPQPQGGKSVTGLLWTLDVRNVDGPPQGPAPAGEGWLGKISLGMPKDEALKIARGQFGEPETLADTYEWRQKGFGKPGAPAIDGWSARLSCKNGTVQAISILYSGDNRVAAAKSDLMVLSSALQNFRLDCDRYPTAKEGLAALTTMPPKLKAMWLGPYLTKPVGKDPWGHPYVYIYLGRDRYRVESYGSDGKPGGVGDAADIVESSD